MKQFSSYQHTTYFTSLVENWTDSNHLASQKPAHLHLHCFQNRIYPGSVQLALIGGYIFFLLILAGYQKYPRPLANFKMFE